MTPNSGRQTLNALPSGTVLHDYIIDSELGSGGFSLVYLARHRLHSDWLFAIKEYFPRELVARDNEGVSVHPVSTDANEAFEDGLRRFRDEAQQLRRFRNERYIVSCVNYFEANGTAYLVMDYDDGLPLSEFLRHREAAGHPFTEADLRAVVEPLLEGLEVVHRAGALHRDIKPGNIFVRRPDDVAGRPAQPVLIDFGAAKQNYLALHSRSQAPYTPGYAAYEQLSSEGDLGPWTDIYAVGALMWRMVAGGCADDARLHAPNDSTDGAVRNVTPRAVETRSYALHSGQPDPMAPAVELGAGRFSPNLLVAIDACLALIPEHRVQSCEELRLLLEPLEMQDLERHEESSQPVSAENSAGAAAKQPQEQRDVDNDNHGHKDAEVWKKIRGIWRTVTGRLKRYEQQKRLIPSRAEHRKHFETPLEKRGKATSCRAPTIRSLGIAALILAMISLGATLFLRIPLTPEQVGPRFDARNLLVAAIRQHNSLLNLYGLAYEYIRFEADPQFDGGDLVRALEDDNWLNVSRLIGAGPNAGVVTESVLDRFDEGTQVDLDELVRTIEAVGTVGSRASIRAFSQARSLSEYEYLNRKFDQEFWDSRKLVEYAGILGTLAAIAVIVSDPIVLFLAGAVISFALRRGLFATRRGALWGAGIGVIACGGIVAVQQAILHIAQHFRTLDVSVTSVLFSAFWGSLLLGGVGAFVSRRMHEAVAAMQDSSVRFGAICGLCTPVLQLVFARLGLANDLNSIETLSLAFSTFVIVAIYYLLLGGISFFAKRREWVVWLLALGELHAHAIASIDSDSILEYTAAVIVFPLMWMPSAVILELVFRLFDNLESPILLRRFLQSVLLGLVGYLTWTVFADQPAGGF